PLALLHVLDAPDVACDLAGMCAGYEEIRARPLGKFQSALIPCELPVLVIGEALAVREVPVLAFVVQTYARRGRVQVAHAAKAVRMGEPRFGHPIRDGRIQLRNFGPDSLYVGLVALRIRLAACVGFEGRVDA